LAIYISTECILPNILPTPTPTALPLNLISINLSNPNSLANHYDIIVDYAPLSTNA